MMNTSFIYSTPAWLLCFFLFLLMMLASYGGFRSRQKNQIPADNLGPVEGSLFGLLGLLLAFTFSMSASRYDNRRSVIVEETNDIGTAVLRADMYNDSAKLGFQKDFKQYINARIAYYDAGTNETKIAVTKDAASKAAMLLWNRATALSKISSNLAATNQMIPALNQMIDVTTVREASLRAKVPDIIILLLFSISIACGFLAGFEIPVSKRINWITVLSFSILTVLVIYVIMDLDQPRSGFINLNSNQQAMKDLQQLIR